MYIKFTTEGAGPMKKPTCAEKMTNLRFEPRTPEQMPAKIHICIVSPAFLIYALQAKYRFTAYDCDAIY